MRVAEKMIKHQKAEIEALTAKSQKDWEAIWSDTISDRELNKLAQSKLKELGYQEKRQLIKEVGHKNANIKTLELISPA
ncbi:MAG: hypothetical protein WCG01_00615 [bacterium]